jgi:superfamily II DNA or RNA helicase
VSKVSSAEDGLTYDIEVEEDHNFYASGILVHNCHRGDQQKYSQLLKSCPAQYHLGLTATPVRPDGSGLGSKNWDSLVVGATLKGLIADGRLVPARIYEPPGLRKRRLEGGKVKPSGDPIEFWMRYARGKRTIAFLPSVATANDLADRFRAAGVPSAVLSAKSEDEERTAVLAKLKAGEVMWLANVDLFTEGMDCPEIEACQIMRKWDSLWALIQGAGRAFRTAPWVGKTEAVILDHTAATSFHGYPAVEPDWRLDESGAEFAARHRAKVERELKDPADCRRCGAVFAGTKKCPYCGEPIPVSNKKVALEFDTEGLAPAGAKAAKAVSKEQKAWDRILWWARHRGMSCGAAFMRFKRDTKKTPQEAGVRPLFGFQQRDVPVGEAEEAMRAPSRTSWRG